MKILFVTETLSIGGAETFVLRLASRVGIRHEVILLNLHPWASHPMMLDKVPSHVRYMESAAGANTLLNKADSAFLKLGINYSSLERTAARSIRDILTSEHPEIVHSHIFKADYYTALARKSVNWGGRHVITNHADYLLFHRQPPTRLLNFKAKLKTTLESVDEFVNISDEQVAFTKDWPQTMKLSRPPQFHKILNGYESPNSAQRSRAELGLAEEDFVFGMVSRGVPEKGWQPLADAFVQLNRPKTKLLLVGDGPAIAALKEKHGSDPRFVFAGFSNDPVSYIRLFDVGILPTTAVGESLPTVIIEYLYCGKPVIATNIGEVGKMLGDGAETPAGELLPIEDGVVKPVRIQEAMARMLDDRNRLTELSRQAALAVKKFDMDTCVAAYEKLYTNA